MWPSKEALQAQTEKLMKDCRHLLEMKTEVTQSHFERAAELRREVMLFEAVDYLELRLHEISKAQVLSALHMLKLVEQIAPADALERLRSRLGRRLLSIAECLPEDNSSIRHGNSDRHTKFL